MSRFETIPVDFATIAPTREFFEGKQRIVRIIDEKDLKEPMDLCIPKKKSNFVSLEEDNPELAKEFDLELNYPLTPNDLSKGTARKVWWTILIEDLDTLFYISWLDSVNHRREGRKCPYLRGLRVHSLFNSLEVRRPIIASQWHPIKNNDLKPTDVTEHSGIKVWWYQKYYSDELNKEFEFEWPSRVADRVILADDYNPFIKGILVKKGFNDLATKRKDLLDEWCWEKNNDFTPYEVTEYSEKRVYWQCKTCGYIYSQYICARTARNRGCRECNKSNFQKTVDTILKNNNILFDSEVNLYKNYRFDISIDNNDLLIENDGDAHWKSIPMFDKKCTLADRIKWDNDKNNFALDQGIPLLRIPYLDLRSEKNKKKITQWVLDFVDTRIVPQEIIDFYAEKNPQSNYPEVARKLNEIQKQKETVAS